MLNEIKKYGLRWKQVMDNDVWTAKYGRCKMEHSKIEPYHGSGQIVEFPEIRKTSYTKDFDEKSAWIWFVEGPMADDTME